LGLENRPPPELPGANGELFSRKVSRGPVDRKDPLDSAFLRRPENRRGGLRPRGSGARLLVRDQWCLVRPTCPALLGGVDIVRGDRPDLFPAGESFRSSDTLKRAILALDKFQNALSDPSDPDEIAEATQEIREHSEALSYLLTTAKVAETYLKGVENSVKEAIRAGIPVPGFKLQKKSGAVSVENIQGLFNTLQISPELFLSACKVSTTDLVEVVPFEKLETIILGSGAVIPSDLRKKNGVGLLKAGAKKAFDLCLDSLGLVSKAPDSFSVVADKKKEGSK